MKQLLLGLLTLAVTAFGGDAAWIEHPEYIPVRPVGTVPEAFVEIVEENRFAGCVASKTTVLRSSKQMNGLEVELLDAYGLTIASRVLETDLYCTSARKPYATQDGGFLLCSIFEEGKQISGDTEFSAIIWKLDELGNVEWTFHADGDKSSAIQYCGENADAFYFFGNISSPWDVHILKIDKLGMFAGERTLSGSDFDNLVQVQVEGDKISLYVDSQSTDGDFLYDGPRTASGYPEYKAWEIILDPDLNVLSRENHKSAVLPHELFVEPIGTLDGQAVFPDDPLFTGFTNGKPELLLDYGDFYLIVATHITGEYPDKPIIVNLIWYTYETVYSAYDKTNRLLWRTAVDSTPDYPSAGGLH